MLAAASYKLLNAYLPTLSLNLFKGALEKDIF